MSIVDQENESVLVLLKLLRAPQGRSHRPWSLSKARLNVYSPICVNSRERDIRKSVSYDFAVSCTKKCLCSFFYFVYYSSYFYIYQKYLPNFTKMIKLFINYHLFSGSQA